MADPEEEFWRFSLGFYGRPGVAPACLALQDRHGRDANLLLYACWLGLSGRGRWSESDRGRAEAAVAPWRGAVIEKLREARRAIKAEGAAMAELYEAAKAVELAAERAAQQRLARLAPPSAARPAAARAEDARVNLSLCLDAAARETAAPILAAIDAAATSVS